MRGPEKMRTDENGEEVEIKKNKKKPNTNWGTSYLQRGAISATIIVF